MKGHLSTGLPRLVVYDLLAPQVSCHNNSLLAEASEYFIFVHEKGSNNLIVV